MFVVTIQSVVSPLVTHVLYVSFSHNFNHNIEEEKHSEIHFPRMNEQNLY